MNLMKRKLQFSYFSRHNFYGNLKILLKSIVPILVFLLLPLNIQAGDGVLDFNSIDDVINVLRQDPNNVKALTAKGIFLAGQPEAAIAIEKAISINPDYEMAYSAKLWNSVVNNNTKEAWSVIELSNTRKFKDSYVIGFIAVGKIYLQLAEAKTVGELKEITANLDSAIKLSQDNPKIIIRVGEVLLENGLVQESIVAFDSALRLDSKSLIAHYCKSIALSRMGKSSEAIEVAEMAIKLDPKSELPYQAKGFALSIAGKYKESITAYQQALKISPDFVLVLAELAAVQTKNGNARESQSNYQKALKINLSKSTKWYNQLAWGQYGRGKALLGIGKLNEALEAFDKALLINSRYEDALIGKAITLGKLGKINSAVKLLEIIKEVNINSPNLKDE